MQVSLGYVNVMLVQVRKIDRKLKACHNPLLDPESDVYKQRAAAAEQQEQKARDQKVCKSKSAVSHHLNHQECCITNTICAQYTN